MKRIRVADVPDQQFGFITDAGKRITMRLRYNPTADRWTFDLAQDDAWALYGRKITTGVDLMRGTGLTGFPSIFAHSETGAIPNRANLPNGAVGLYIA